MKIVPPRWRVILYCGIALFVSLFVFDEPFTRGHFFSTWLRYGNDHQHGRFPEGVFAPNVEEIEPALRRIGPRGIPILLKKLDATDPAWKRSLDDWQTRTDWFPRRMRFQFRWAEEEQQEAVYGFSVLKTQAVSAIPALSQRLHATNSAAAATYCLALIGSPSAPALKMALTNEQPDVRRAAVYGLETNPFLLKQVLPEMQRLRTDPDERIAAAAFFLLSRHSPTNEAATFLREALGDSRNHVVGLGLVRIRELKTNARPFIPEISNLLIHPHRGLRMRASNTLKEIDPSIAFAAGVNTNPPVTVTNRSPRARGRSRF